MQKFSVMKNREFHGIKANNEFNWIFRNSQMKQSRARYRDYLIYYLVILRCNNDRGIERDVKILLSQVTNHLKTLISISRRWRVQF